MNFAVSVLFRAIPLVFGAICLAYGLYIRSGGADAGHFVAGYVNVALGLYVLLGSDRPYRIAPGFILIGLALVCFSILSKVLLPALVWRRSFPLADRIPILPIITALTCLFFSAFLFEAAVTDPQFFIPARVMVGLGAVCFTLFSIVSILEAGTSG
ncbi:DUF2776 family protein [Streptosporangium pseudovulgare]|uniref:Uncharacterized protein n=1 Tax=Streptosporangium pseudovulgare TaxID=35765 RepID=A0ABQ2R969_9ACTN|nr:DUF2776 family protein [Streptosporangium pseudovulgare]GGQ16509.1 hypothetical protein GCM10010140_53520 [Streptosporangium pseudovulgare]